MDLDELKQSWKETPVKKISNKNIMELIQHKSFGPLASLKRSLRKQIGMMMIIPAVLLLTNSNDISKPLTSVLFWTYVAFCAGVVIFSYMNYRTVQKMESMSGVVKTNLEIQINKLKIQTRWNMAAIRLMTVLMIIMLEVVPYYQDYRMLNTWHSLHPVIRFGSYAAFLAIQYFLSRKISDMKFGRHIRHLETLLRELK